MDIEQYSNRLPSSVISPELLERFMAVYATTILANPQYENLCTDELGKEQNLKTLLGKKLVHTIAAVGYFEQVLKRIDTNRQLSDETLIAVLIFELLEVDFADTLGEIEELRKKESLNQLFINLKDIALKDSDLKVVENTSDSNLNGKLIDNWNLFLSDLAHKFYEICSDKSGWEQASVVIDRRLTEYYSFIALDHARTETERSELRADLLASTYLNAPEWKGPPAWVNNEDIWLNFLGDSISFLVPIFTLIELPEAASNHPEIHSKLIFAFRGVGLLNVWLDDILDVQEDKGHGDGNLYEQVDSGKILGENDKPYTSEEFFQHILYTINEDFDSLSTDQDLSTHINAFRCITKQMLNIYYLMGMSKGIESKELDLIKKYLPLP